MTNDDADHPHFSESETDTAAGALIALAAKDIRDKTEFGAVEAEAIIEPFLSCPDNAAHLVVALAMVGGQLAIKAFKEEL